MHYHVARDGHQLGRVRETDLKAGLTDGRYLATDLVWCDGMAQWTPLGEVMGASPLPQPTSSSTGTTGANPSPAPAGPAMSRTPAPAFTPAPAPAPRFGSRTALPVAGTAPASGLAMTALISGIVAFLLCGLGGIATLVAIITGHVSLGRINRSAGMVGGRGMALAGLILGYVSILSTISGIAIMASVSLPAFVKVQERGILLAQEAVLKEVHVACRVYAAANSGKYPATLEELVQQGALKAETLEKLNTLKARSWVGEPGFHYHGEGVDDTTPGEAPILVSRAESRSGETIVLYHDGRVEQTPAER